MVIASSGCQPCLTRMFARLSETPFASAASESGTPEGKRRARRVLRFCCSRLAQAQFPGSIVPVHVHSLNRQSIIVAVGKRPVPKEREGVPLGADRDAPSAVVGVAGGTGVQAALPHAPPDPMQSTVAFAVLEHSRARNLRLKAAARYAFASAQVVGVRCPKSPAVAAAKPKGHLGLRWRPLQNHPSPKPLSG